MRAPRLTIRRLPLNPDRSQSSSLPEPARIPSSIRDLLAEPAWSVKSLLPPELKSSRPARRYFKSASEPQSIGPTTARTQEITSEKLHHLLRLSALPPPKSTEEEETLLDSLHRHLHFVRAVQGVDTSKPSTWDHPRPNTNDPVAQKVWNPDPNANRGEVEPLITIRDETYEGIGEATIHLRDLWPALLKEEKHGVNRVVRRKWKVNTNWDEDRVDATDTGSKGLDDDNNITHKNEDQIPVEHDESSTVGESMDAAEIDKRSKMVEALAEKRDWWIDVDRMGTRQQDRKRAKFFFVKRAKA